MRVAIDTQLNHCILEHSKTFSVRKTLSSVDSGKTCSHINKKSKIFLYCKVILQENIGSSNISYTCKNLQ